MPSFVDCQSLLFLRRTDIYVSAYAGLNLQDRVVKLRSNDKLEMHQTHVRGTELGLEAPVLTGTDNRMTYNDQPSRGTQVSGSLAYNNCSRK